MRWGGSKREAIAVAAHKTGWHFFTKIRKFLVSDLCLPVNIARAVNFVKSVNFAKPVTFDTCGAYGGGVRCRIKRRAKKGRCEPCVVPRQYLFGFGVRAVRFGFRFSNFESRGLGLGFWFLVSGLRFRVSEFGFRVSVLFLFLLFLFVWGFGSLASTAAPRGPASGLAFESALGLAFVWPASGLDLRPASGLA